MVLSRKAKYGLAPFVLMGDVLLSFFLGVAAHAFDEPETALAVLMAISAVKGWWAMDWFRKWRGLCE